LQIKVERIINKPVASNCYIVYKEQADDCLVVDPSYENGVYLQEILLSKGLKAVYIILTHEHFDHISSVEYLRDAFRCKLVSSIHTSENITNPKKNFSFFYDGVGYSCAPSDIIVDRNEYILYWDDIPLQFYLTPGHSEGSICFMIDKYFFTGDTMIMGHNAVVKLPGGNKEALRNSLAMIAAAINDDNIICPGHGNEFKLSEINSLVKQL
jgi:hydroxyacylglutathione hydrolase